MYRRPVVVERRRGDPLLRTAVVGGIAYSAGSSAAQKSEAKSMEQQAAIAQEYQQPVAVPNMGPDKLAQLKLLGELHESGVLTDAEFEIEKQKILQS